MHVFLINKLAQQHYHIIYIHRHLYYLELCWRLAEEKAPPPHMPHAVALAAGGDEAVVGREHDSLILEDAREDGIMSCPGAHSSAQAALGQGGRWPAAVALPPSCACGRWALVQNPDAV